MANHRPNALTHAELGALLGHAQAHTIGCVSWKRAKQVTPEGTTDVATGLVTVSDGQLLIHYTVYRPWEVKMVYLVNAVAVRRACLNTKHRPLPFGDHVHDYVPSTGGEHCAVSDAFSTVPMQPDVDPAALRTVFHEFAGVCAIEVEPGCWVDPPTAKEGAPR